MVIHFICRGNALRSIIAEAYLKSLRLPGVAVASSGTVAEQYKVANQERYSESMALLREHGIAQCAKTHYADQLTPERLKGVDVAVCANRLAWDEARRLCPLPEKTYVWDVTDLGEPGRIYTNESERRAYAEDVYSEVTRNVDRLVDQLTLRN